MVKASLVHFLSQEVDQIPNPLSYERVSKFKAVIKSYSKRYPEFLALSLELSMIEQATFTETLDVLKRMFDFVFRAKKPVVFLNSCHVLLFHSSTKPAYWPAMGFLADRLARKGFACTLISSSRMETRRINSSGEISVESILDYRAWRKFGLGRFQAFKVILRGLRAMLVLFLLALSKDRQVLVNLLRDPIAVWYHLMMSAHRFALSRYLLNELRPRLLLVNHERVPLGAELVMSPAPFSTLKVQVCNEPPHHVILPFLSDEVWVWNDMAARLVEQVIPDGSEPRIEVIGSSEVDVALQPPELPSEAEIELRQITDGKPALLLLSEYFPGVSHAHHDYPLSKKVLAWLAIAAKQCPEWYFILKPRQHKLGQRPPGTEFLEGLPNFSISDREIPYRQLLNWDNLIAVAAVSSSGLFAAAGVGKTAIRLAVTNNRYCWPVIEDVSIVVNKHQELVQVLKNIGAEPMVSDDDQHFPYRGRTIERMEQLCLERLKHNIQASI